MYVQTGRSDFHHWHGSIIRGSVESSRLRSTDVWREYENHPSSSSGDRSLWAAEAHCQWYWTLSGDECSSGHRTEHEWQVDLSATDRPAASLSSDRMFRTSRTSSIPSGRWSLRIYVIEIVVRFRSTRSSRRFVNTIICSSVNRRFPQKSITLPSFSIQWHRTRWLFSMK